VRAIRDSTARAYGSAWRKFCGWCEGTGGLAPLPADDHTLAEFIKDAQEDGATLQTQRLYIVAIKRAHAEAGHPSPAGLLTDIQLSKAQAGARRKIQPITLAQLEKLTDLQPASMKEARDLALLSLAFCAGLTTHEAQTLTHQKIKFSELGIVYRPEHIPSAYRVSNSPCYIPAASQIGSAAISSLRAWLNIKSGAGAIFTRIDRHGNEHRGPLSGQGLRDIVRTRFKRAGLAGPSYTFGSLRKGLAQALQSAGVERHAMRSHLRLHDDRGLVPPRGTDCGFTDSPLSIISPLATKKPHKITP